MDSQDQSKPGCNVQQQNTKEIGSTAESGAESGGTHLFTQLAQIGNRSEKETGTVSTPVYFSTAYRHEGIGQSTGYDYTRTANPTRSILEDAIARLEEGDRGLACSSGMAAIHTICGLFEQGDELLVGRDLYGGTYRLFEDILKRYGIGFRYVDVDRPDQAQALVTERTKAIFVESPTNPLMQEADLDGFAEIAHRHDLLFIVDNTFYTPLLQKPLKAGAHIVIHSATKYLGGHNDVLAGLIVAKGEELGNRLADLHNAIGATLSALDSWLLMRGMKTLGLRFTAQQNNARRLAEFLSSHKAVDEVLYPGQGGMLSFRICREEAVQPLLHSLQIITFAESLGGVESFITYPATHTHADIPEDVRVKNGICNRLLRFSAGIEEADDLERDLDQALNIAYEQSLEEVRHHV